jgi:hypothetical protein
MGNASEEKAKRQNKEKYDVVLTVYLDGGGDLQFHGGESPKTFKDDVGASNAAKILRRFYIKGKIVDEDGLIEPIRV